MGGGRHRHICSNSALPLFDCTDTAQARVRPADSNMCRFNGGLSCISPFSIPSDLPPVRSGSLLPLSSVRLTFTACAFSRALFPHLDRENAVYKLLSRTFHRQVPKQGICGHWIKPRLMSIFASKSGGTLLSPSNLTALAGIIRHTFGKNKYGDERLSCIMLHV